ncbi:hypothetical protein [Actinospongicola halichondriae]|uniref:hypothetical protein n=1 Tax=Actinospongicola halichondriae TaxID=3236844 RepID=UPI003D58EC2F
MSNPAHDGPIPEEQQPGHQPSHDADKPDLDAFAERLGVVAEGDEPAGAPSVTTDSTSTTLARIRNRQQAILVGGAAIAVVAAILTIRRLRRR